MPFAPPTYVGELGETAFSAVAEKKELALTTTPGELLVVWVSAEEGGGTLGFSIEGGGLTWTVRETFIEASKSYVKVWTAVADATTVTVKITKTGTDGGGQTAAQGHWGIEALGFTNATFGQVTKAKSTSGAPSLTWTPTQDNVAAVLINADWAAKSEARAWRTPSEGEAITETVYLQDGTHFTIYGGVHKSLGAKGSKTVGLTEPATQNYVLLAVEILGPESGAPPAVTPPWGLGQMLWMRRFFVPPILLPGTEGGPAEIPLAASGGQSSAALTLEAPTELPLGASVAISTAALLVSHPETLTLGASAATSTATLKATAPTSVSLSASAAQSTATLAITVPTQIALSASAATSTATLALTTGEAAGPVTVPLSAVAATTAATLALSAPTSLALGASVATSAATLKLARAEPVALNPSAAQSSAALTIFTPLALSPAAATSTAALTFSVPTPITLGKVEAQSTAALPGLGAGAPILVLHTGAQSEVVLSLTAPTKLALSAAASSSSAALKLTAPTMMALASAALSSAKAEIRTTADLGLSKVIAQSTCFLVVEAEARAATITLTDSAIHLRLHDRATTEVTLGDSTSASKVLLPSESLFPSEVLLLLHGGGAKLILTDHATADLVLEDVHS